MAHFSQALSTALARFVTEQKRKTIFNPWLYPCFSHTKQVQERFQILSAGAQVQVMAQNQKNNNVF